MLPHQNNTLLFSREVKDVKDETPFRFAHAEVRIQLVVICDLTRYQLDHGGGLLRSGMVFHQVTFYRRFHHHLHRFEP